MSEFVTSLFRSIFYQPIYNLLFYFVYLLPGHSLGLAIILLTILVRLALLPSSTQSIRAQRELAALQPEIDKIRQKYKKNPQKLNEAMIALYQTHGVNPLGSCLPLLIQFPILIILYRVIIDGINSNNFSLLYSFIPQPEVLHTMFLGADLTQPSIILAVVAGGFQFVQTWQMQRKNRPITNTKQFNKENSAQVAQKITSKFIYFMPLITVFIAATLLPSALTVYWSVTTVFSIGQQWFLMKVHPEINRPHIAVKVRGKKVRNKKV